MKKRVIKPIAYCEHPLSQEEKFEITSKGFKVVDVKFKPDEIGEKDKVVMKPKAKK